MNTSEDQTETLPEPPEGSEPASQTDRGPLGGIWTLTVDRPVATLMIAIGVAVFGYLSFGQLPLALMPELSYPTLTVRTQYEGAAPEEVEAEITRPLEEFLRTVEGLRAIHSTSRAGLSDVVLEFQWDTDMDFSSQRVRERIDVITFPRAAERPLVLRYDPALDPIMRLGIVSDAEKGALTKVRVFAEDEVARALEKIKGVAIVKVYGGRQEVVRVDLDQQRMSQLGLSVEEVQQRLVAENVNLAGGQIDEGGVRYLVRTLNEFEDLDELRRMSVGLRQGEIVRLEQIGRVYLDYKEREVITRIDGRESVEIEIFKEADANIVQVASAVRDKLFGSPAQQAFVKDLKEKKAQADDPQDSKASASDKQDPNAKQDKEDPRIRKAKKAQERAMTDFLANDLPEQIRMELLSDQSTFIRNAIDEVVGTALMGGLWAILVLYVFLRSPTNTLIIGLAIPLSVVATFALMRLTGLSLNIMSLGGLALGIGMLVDNSIVVLESIHRCREEGDDRRASAVRGTREVGGAVMASTLTTTAVFFPIVFIEGVAGQLFGDLALTVVFALLASLVVALLVVPMLSAWQPNLNSDSQEGKGQAEKGWRRWVKLVTWSMTRDDLRARVATLKARGALRNVLLAPVELLIWLYIIVRAVVLGALELVFVRIGAALLGGALWLLGHAARALGWVLGWVIKPGLWVFDKVFDGLAALYPKVLRAALSQRLLVLVVALGLFGLGVWMLRDLGMELIPALHQGQFKAEVRLPVGTALEDTANATTALEAKLTEFEDIERLSSFIGVEKTSTSEGDRGEHSATLHVVLTETRDIEAAEQEAMSRIRQVLSGRPGVQYELVRPTLFTLQTPIQVELRGRDLRLLKIYADRLTAALAPMEELTDVRTNLRSGYPEVQVEFDRDRLAAHGLSVRQVAEAIQAKIRGDAPTEMRRDERRLDILVRANRADVGTVGDLKDLIVGYQGTGAVTDAAALAQGAAQLATQVPIRLGSVARIRIEEGPSEIRRLDGQRAAVIEANTAGLDLQTVIERVSDRVAAVPLPRGFTVTVGGQSEEIKRATDSLLLALLLAIFLVYIVMASQFESVLAPLVIIFTIPLAAVGVAAALWWTGTPLSVVVFIGLIMLAGIVVNNAIVLVDYAIVLGQRGQSQREALIEACSVRLRPVLITTLTTVLGLLPMALGLGEGAEIRAPMAITVIAGLLSSTVLTLLVIPVVYDLVMRAKPAAKTQPS